MKLINSKRVLSTTLALLTAFSSLSGLNQAKVSAAPSAKSNAFISENMFTMKNLNALVDYNPDVDFEQKQDEIKKDISKCKHLMKADSSKEAWYRAIVTFSKILFAQLKNINGCRGFSKSDMQILSALCGLDNLSIFEQLNSIREILLNKGLEEMQSKLCYEIVLDFMNSNGII